MTTGLGCGPKRVAHSDDVEGPACLIEARRVYVRLTGSLRNPGGMSDWITAIAGFVGTVTGAIVAIVGVYITQRHQEEREDRLAGEQKIQAVVAAAEDLHEAFRNYRNSIYTWRAMAWAAVAAPIVATGWYALDDPRQPGRKLFGRALRDVATSFSPSGSLDRLPDKSTAYYVELVLRPHQRLTAALTPFRAAPDAAVAQAAKELYTAAGHLATDGLIPVKGKSALKDLHDRCEAFEKAAKSAQRTAAESKVWKGTM